MPAIFGPKPVTLIVGVYQYTVVFDITDFNAASYGPHLAPPFSLTIVYDNRELLSAFVGIRLDTPQGIVKIGDRDSIGHIPRQSIGMFTGASTPQLANIPFTVNKVTATITYLFRDISAFVGGNNIQIWYDVPTQNLGPQPYIGRDYRSIDPGSTILMDSGASVTANTSANLITTTASPTSPLRLLVQEIHMRSAPTPSYTGDIRLYAMHQGLSGNSRTLSELFSLCDRYATGVIYPNVYVEPGEIVQIFADNNNSTRAFVVKGSIKGEYRV